MVRQHVVHRLPRPGAVTRPGPGLREIIRNSRHLLLDFDGPICSIFAGTPAPVIAAQLRQKLQAAGITLPPEAETEDDPLEVFRATARLGDSVAELAQGELARLETLAVTTAQPTPGAADLITAAHQSGRTVTIVSNNSSHAISQYLAAHNLPARVIRIIGRDDSDPDRMKPQPLPGYGKQSPRSTPSQANAPSSATPHPTYSPDAWQASPSSATPTSPAKPTS
jgi:hypothetical protein